MNLPPLEERYADLAARYEALREHCTRVEAELVRIDQAMGMKSASVVVQRYLSPWDFKEIAHDTRMTDAFYRRATDWRREVLDRFSRGLVDTLYREGLVDLYEYTQEEIAAKAEMQVSTSDWLNEAVNTPGFRDIYNQGRVRVFRARMYVSNGRPRRRDGET